MTGALGMPELQAWAVHKVVRLQAVCAKPEVDGIKIGHETSDGPGTRM